MKVAFFRLRNVCYGSIVSRHPQYDLGEHEVIVCVASYPESYYKIDSSFILEFDLPDDPDAAGGPWQRVKEIQEHAELDDALPTSEYLMDEQNMLKYDIVAKRFFCGATEDIQGNLGKSRLYS